MEKGDTTGDVAVPQATINVTIKFSGRTIPISVSLDSTVKELKCLLQPITDVLPRGQKLIFKGKLLVDDMTLRSSEVTNGAKIMLIASQGLHQGGGPIREKGPDLSNLRRTAIPDKGEKDTFEKSLFERWEASGVIGIPLSKRELKEASQGLLQGDGPIREEAPHLSNLRRTAIPDKGEKDTSVEKSQFERWKATGVIALSERDLKVVPQEVWTCGSSARVLDLSHNSIQDVPAAIGSLCSMQKLLLNVNCILDESISWEGLSSLKSLTVLSLSQNLLTMLPSALGALTCLRQLHIANNQLTSLPIEIGCLTELQVFKANNNRISTIPSCMGSCTSLVEVDLSSNLLVELPDTIGELTNLKALYLKNNGLKSLPSTLFKMCIQLSTLNLHGTEITMDHLRQFEGWENFDERRRLKHQKQLNFRVEGPGAFDEGADKN